MDLHMEGDHIGFLWTRAHFGLIYKSFPFSSRRGWPSLWLQKIQQRQHTWRVCAKGTETDIWEKVELHPAWPRERSRWNMEGKIQSNKKGKWRDLLKFPIYFMLFKKKSPVLSFLMFTVLLECRLRSLLLEVLVLAQLLQTVLICKQH